MLNFSKRLDYALASLAYLAKLDTPVNARTVAQFYQFPPRLTSNILKELASKNILKSTRGAYGGYLLARKATEVSVYEIILAIEGPVGLVDCTLHGRGCNAITFCSANAFMNYIHNHITSLLKRIKLADILRAEFTFSNFFIADKSHPFVKNV